MIKSDNNTGRDSYCFKEALTLLDPLAAELRVSHEELVAVLDSVSGTTGAYTSSVNQMFLE